MRTHTGAHRNPARRGAADARAGQRGAATLVVVMLLFFVVSLVAAYASRNLIFEQKTSANQYRASQAFEAAEAGIEWALAMLNSGRIDAACVASTDVANNSFRDRYLTIQNVGIPPLPPPEPAPGSYRRNTWVNAGITTPLTPGCVRDNAGWTCSCPGNGNPVLAAPAGNGPFPAFRLRFETVAQPGAVRILSTGCTRLDEACLSSGQGTAGEAAATVSVVAALSPGLATPPSAALTVRGDLDVGAAPIRLENTDLATNGITALVGGTVTAGGALLVTVPGTPGELSIVAGDPVLAASSADDMFAAQFRLHRNTFRNQPAAVRLDDCAAACSTKLRDAAQANPGRILWVDGDATLESDVVLGTAADPVLIVVRGNIDFTAASIQIVGLVYSQAADWANTGSGATVQGAIVAEGNFNGNGAPRIVYDPAVLRLLNLRTGSLVRVPGSWRDF